MSKAAKTLAIVSQIPASAKNRPGHILRVMLNLDSTKWTKWNVPAPETKHYIFRITFFFP